MSNLKPQDRPDYNYWMTSWQERKKPSEEGYTDIIEKLKVYSSLRFPVGQRLKLVRDYHGTPKGTGCTVILGWPKTAIRWDKWAQTGRGSERREQNVLFDLDMHLEEI